MRKFYVFLATMLVAMFSFGAMAEDPYVFVGAYNSWDLAGAPEFVKQADGTYKIDKIDKKQQKNVHLSPVEYYIFLTEKRGIRNTARVLASADAFCRLLLLS